MTRRNRFTRGIGLASATALTATMTLYCPAVAAQEAESAKSPAQTIGIDDIVVTAQKKSRLERAQDVPLPITALGPAQLDNAKFRSLADLAISAPGVSLSENGGQRGVAAFNFRGLGINSTSPSTEPAVGVFVDGVYLGTSYGVVLDTFDLEGVEILRGPQGTLQGRNVTGGAVLIRTRRPGTEFAIKGKASIETGPEYNLAGSVEDAFIGDALRVKVAGYYKKDEGWFHNPTLGRDMGRSKTWFVRPTILIEPDKSFNQTFIFERGRTRGDGPTFQRMGRNEEVGARGFENLQDEPGYTRIDWESATSETNVSVGFGNGVITNIFGYRAVKHDGLSDYDGGVGAIYNNYVYLNQNQYSDELRYAGTFGKLDLTVGAFWFTQNYLYLENRQLLNAAINRVSGGKINQSSYALFAQGEYHLSDKLSLIVGGRYSDDKKRAELYLLPAVGNVSTCNFASHTCTGSVPPIYRDRHEWDSFSPKVSVTWRPAQDVLLYGTIANGVRNGGYNVRSNANAASLPGVVPVIPANTQPVADPLYNDESLWSYEVGFKSDLFDRKLRWNGSIFYNDTKNLQRDTVQPTPFGTQAVLANATDADIYGFESEVMVAPIRGLRLNATVSYTEVDYKNVKFDLSGDGVINQVDYELSPPRAAKWSYSIGATANHEFAGGSSLSANVNFAYRGRAPASDDNRYFITTRRLLTANLTYALPDERFSLSVYGRNLLNDDNEGFAIDAGAALGYVLRPLEEGRSIGVEARFSL